ncbi:MAG TPA: luciferase family protein [Vicinamibacterales bacterium]|nr:luciferase family protein [Vicinamibacterales bacterium]
MTESIATRIEREVASWPDVTVEPHRFGGREFRLGRRELGHLHGDRQPICRFRFACGSSSCERAGRAASHPG